MVLPDLDDLLVGCGLVAVTVALAVLAGWPWALLFVGLVTVAAGILLGLRGESERSGEVD